MTADVTPYLQRLLDDHAAMGRVRALRARWNDHVIYGTWNERREYEVRRGQLDRAINPPETGVQS